jgi:hypothetical protein
MREEFEVYGLPDWSMSLVGFAKITFGGLLLAGLWTPALVKPTAGAIAVLMMGAVAMHIKVRDPWKKSVPAISVLALSLFIVLGGEF